MQLLTADVALSLRLLLGQLVMPFFPSRGLMLLTGLAEVDLGRGQLFLKLLDGLIVSPGIILATFMLKTLGRCCSSKEALWPCCWAFSNFFRADCRCFISALITSAPIIIFIPWTEARVDAGNI